MRESSSPRGAVHCTLYTHAYAGVRAYRSTFLIVTCKQKSRAAEIGVFLCRRRAGAKNKRAHTTCVAQLVCLRVYVQCIVLGDDERFFIAIDIIDTYTQFHVYIGSLVIVISGCWRLPRPDVFIQSEWKLS